MRLENKVAIISGGSRGMGAVEAELFVQQGAKVLVGDVRDDEGRALVEKIGADAVYAHLDVTSEDDWAAAVKKATDRYGKLDILVNNAGVSARGTIEETSVEDWDRVMTGNMKTIMLSSKATIPLMIASGGGGSIINISSIAGLRAHSSTPYSASKAGVIGLTFSMAADHAADNIRANVIAPGLVYTPMVAPRMNDDLRQFRSEAAPLKSEGTGWDVGYAALFLASDEARWITGICLPVDAGLTAVHPGTYTPMNQQTRF